MSCTNGLEKTIIEKLKKMDGKDPDKEHGEADALLCALLLSHDYYEIVHLFNNLEKWYS